ncbi:MAG TPA: hypothetical protein ENI34_02920 [candidate division WOR-3 bacterium]|uniref:Uncharacterized protein n=1 Tax=candidate division WOR-3 bacterium TaxID=2052148 RepID=A0A9C9ELY4_UNCW3|nr:hypothetical protein [candidate division WOR-3 bacterium]
MLVKTIMKADIFSALERGKRYFISKICFIIILLIINSLFCVRFSRQPDGVLRIFLKEDSLYSIKSEYFEAVYVDSVDFIMNSFYDSIYNINLKKGEKILFIFQFKHPRAILPATGQIDNCFLIIMDSIVFDTVRRFDSSSIKGLFCSYLISTGSVSKVSSHIIGQLVFHEERADTVSGEIDFEIIDYYLCPERLPYSMVNKKYANGKIIFKAVKRRKEMVSQYFDYIKIPKEVAADF